MSVQDTSRTAYYDIVGTLSGRQNQVLAAIEIYGPMTNMELSEKLDWSINTVTPRTNELVKKGLLCEYERRRCSVTGRMAIVWGKVKSTLF